MEKFVTFKIAKKLKENGFDEGCEFTFYNNYRIRDEIYEKHPGLSDDGYEDLRKKYGGPYKDEEVYGHYIEPLKLYSRNSTIGVNPITKRKEPTNELCSCPNIYQVMKWLRDKKQIHINVSVYYDASEDADCRMVDEWCFWNWDIQNCNSGDVLQDGDDVEYESYEQAAIAGIEYSLDNLI